MGSTIYEQTSPLLVNKCNLLQSGSKLHNLKETLHNEKKLACGQACQVPLAKAEQHLTRDFMESRCHVPRQTKPIDVSCKPRCPMMVPEYKNLSIVWKHNMAGVRTLVLTCGDSRLGFALLPLQVGLLHRCLYITLYNVELRVGTQRGQKRVLRGHNQIRGPKQSIRSGGEDLQAVGGLHCRSLTPCSSPGIPIERVGKLVVPQAGTSANLMSRPAASSGAFCFGLSDDGRGGQSHTMRKGGEESIYSFTINPRSAVQI